MSTPTSKEAKDGRTLQDKLAEVMAEVSYVQKDAKNPHHGYNYASAEAVLGKVNEALAARGIAIHSEAELLHQENDLSIIRVTYAFDDGSDDCVVVQGIGAGKDKQDKGPMKAMTAAQKYAYATAFCISWGDDPEAEGGGKVPAKKAEPVDVDAIRKAITEAKTAAEVQAAKERIVALRSSNRAAYDELRDLFKKTHKAA